MELCPNAGQDVHVCHSQVLSRSDVIHVCIINLIWLAHGQGFLTNKGQMNTRLFHVMSTYILK